VTSRTGTGCLLIINQYTIHMKKYVKLALGLLSVISVLTVNVIYKPKTEDYLHYHAGFKVYIDGTLQDYSDYKYMNFVPCTEHDIKKSKQEEQIEKAHLHDSVGDVVHVHRDGATWGDLFNNIKVELPIDKGLQGYIDGVYNEDILHAPIKPYSTAILIFGDNRASHGKEIVSVEHIKEVEAKSELCGDGREP